MKAIVTPSVPRASLPQASIAIAVPVPSTPPAKLTRTLSMRTNPNIRAEENPIVCKTACYRTRSWTAMMVVVATKASTKPTQA